MEEIEKILENSLMELEKASSILDVVAVKNLYLSKKGKLSVLMNKMRDLSIEERKTFGKEINDAKITLEKIENLINGEETATLIIEDPFGQSNIVSDDAKVSPIPEEKLRELKTGFTIIEENGE